MLIKKRLYFMCFKVGRVESRSANLMDHKLHIFCQDNVCDTQPLLAAFFPQGCWSCSGYRPSQGLSKSSPSTVGCLLVKHMLSRPDTELPYSKSGFYTHKHYRRYFWEISSFLSLCSGVHCMGTLGRSSQCVLFLDSCTSCLDYMAAKFWVPWIILMFCRLRFHQWTFQFKGLSPDFLDLFTCLILICVILLASGEYLCFYD